MYNYSFQEVDLSLELICRSITVGLAVKKRDLSTVVNLPRQEQETIAKLLLRGREMDEILKQHDSLYRENIFGGKNE